MEKRNQDLPHPAVHRMEPWWAALPTVPGHVQHGTRPVVIVSNDLNNTHSPVVSVVPCTTQRRKPTLPTHVYLRGYGLSSGSIAMCEQVMPLDRCIRLSTGRFVNVPTKHRVKMTGVFSPLHREPPVTTALRSFTHLA